MIGKAFQELAEIYDLEGIDFLEDATNVYRTEEFIVKQEIGFCDNGYGCTRLISVDTYYARTRKRDNIYDELFNNDGKRIHSGIYTRTYVY